MARKDDDRPKSVFAHYIEGQEQSEPEPPDQESEPEQTKLNSESASVFTLPKNKFVAHDVDEKTMRSHGALVLFPSLKQVIPRWESTDNTSILECIFRLAPTAAKEIARKDHVPYAIAGTLKEAELINERLRERQIKAGLSTIGKQRSSAHIASLGPLIIFDDDHDVFAREQKLRALGWFAVIYSSWSYMFPKNDTGPEPRGRLVLLLNRTVSPKEYRLLWDAINELLGGGFDEAGQSIALCYGIHARRSADAPFRREFFQGSALDADALIEHGRSLQPLPPQYDGTGGKGTHNYRALAEEIERVKLMGAVRPPDDYNDWYPGAAAFKREYPDDQERAFLCFDAWSSCSLTGYKGSEDARCKFDRVPADYEGPALPVTVGMLYAAARRRATKVLNTLYPPQLAKIVVADAFKHLIVNNNKPLKGDDSKPLKGDDPIEPDSIGAKDGHIALEFLLFCFGEQTIEGIPIPQHVLHEARKQTEERRERNNKEEDEALVAKWNERHAHVLAGGKSCVLQEFKTPEGYTDFKLLSSAAFHEWNGEHQTACLVGNNVVPIEETKLWIRHPKRRKYQDIGFFPGREVPDYYNLWRGFAVEPRKGDCFRFLAHVYENGCQGNDELYAWVMAWFADIFQRPAIKCGTSLTFRGKQGVGKTKIGEVMEGLLGVHYKSVAEPRYVTGQFNSHMISLLMLHADEGFWAGDKKAEGKLKDLVTGKKHPIEFKKKEAFWINNYVRLLVTGNPAWQVPAAFEERRFAVLDMGDTHQNDYPYFAAIDAEMAAGGREALLHHLLFEVDCSKVNLRQIPHTAALLEQKLETASPEQGWWLDILRRGVLPGYRMGDKAPKNEVSTQVLYDDYVEHAKKQGVPRRAIETKLGIFLGKIVGPGLHRSRKDLGENFKISSTEGRDWFYIFPPLSKCRQWFARLLNENITWEGAGDWG